MTLLPEDDTDTGCHYLLIRRNDAAGELAYLRCYNPRPVTLPTRIRVAGNAGASGNPSRPPKGSPASTSTWTTLAMFAHAFLAVATATERDNQPPPAG